MAVREHLEAARAFRAAGYALLALASDAERCVNGEWAEQKKDILARLGEVVARVMNGRRDASA